MERIIVAKTMPEYGDGSQVLVILDDGLPPHIATRRGPWETWSAPLEIESDETGESA